MLASGNKNLLQLPQTLQLIAATPQPDVKPEQDDANLSGLAGTASAWSLP